MRNVILLAALCVAGVVGSADEASAFGRRKKKADCVPVAPVVTYAQPACGCGGGYGSVGGVLPSAFPATGNYYGSGYHGSTYSGTGYAPSYTGAQPYTGTGYAPSYYGAQPYTHSMGYWNSPSPYLGGNVYGGTAGGYRIYR